MAKKSDYGFSRAQLEKALRLANDFQDKADANWRIMAQQRVTRLDIDDKPFLKASSLCSYYQGKVNAVVATMNVLGFPLTRVARKDGSCYWTYETTDRKGR